MPIYEYNCPKCGHFEVIQKASDEPLTKKPDCQVADCPCAAERLISQSAFHLKGSGWYKTDYSSGGGGGGKNGSTKKESSSSESSSEKASSDKPASDVAKKACGTGCGCH